MVVTTKSTAPNGPPVPSRTNSATSAPKAAKKANVKGSSRLKESHGASGDLENKPVEPPMPKPHVPARHPEDEGPFSKNPAFLPSPSKKDKTPTKKNTKKSKPKDKASKGKKRTQRSFDTLDTLFRILFVLLAIYSVLVCPKDTRLEDPVCRNVIAVRERILEPYLYPPIQFIANHPAVAPHIARAKPHVEHAYQVASTQYTALYTKAEIASRPYVIQLRREYNKHMRPRIRVMEYNWRRYRRQAQPYINQVYAKGIRLWIKVEPYVAPVLAKIEEAPVLASLYVIKPLEEAKQKWVDPQLRKIVEKVEEMSASVAEGKGDAVPTVASAPEDTVTATTGYSRGAKDASTTAFSNAQATPVGEYAPPPEPPMKPQEAQVSEAGDIGAADPSPDETLQDPDAELDEFLNELLKEEKVPEPAIPSAEKYEPTPEEIAEHARLRKEETARKRADIEGRHTKWEQKLVELAERSKEELIDALSASRMFAMYDLDNEKGMVQTAAQGMMMEPLKAMKHLRTYLDGLQDEKKDYADKAAFWEKFVGRVESRFSDKVKEAQGTIQKWVVDYALAEQGIVEDLAKRLTDLADEGQADIGMDYSWLDDVSTHDWTRYHALMDTARRHGEEYRDIYSGSHAEAPGNPMNPRLNEIQANLQASIDGFYKDLGKLQEKAATMFTVTHQAPEVSILPIEVEEGQEEAPVMAGGVPVDKIILGRGKEEVEEAIARAEAAHARNEL